MTPDQDLSARLADHLSKEAWYVDMLETQGLDYYDPPYEAKLKDATNKACGNAYRSGQLITLADHERAVQAAVAKAVEASVNAENEACAKLLNNEADDYEADASRFRGGTDPHHDRMDLATTARKYAAAIRSRGVAG